MLIGVSNYQDPSFPSVPAAERSLWGVHRMLVDEELGGWSYDQVTAIADPVDCRRVMRDLRRLAQDTTGVLLLYFVGHGTVTENGDLVLAVTDTSASEPDDTGLEYTKIRSALLRSPAMVKAVVLDCCYSGRVIEVLAGDDDEQFLANHADIRGTYTLTAADRAAHAGQSGACTAFTGELLDLIRTGVIGGPPVLTFAELYPHLRQRLIAANLPHPNQRGTDTADKWPVTRNVADGPSMMGRGRGPEDASAVRPQVPAPPIAKNEPVRRRPVPEAAGIGPGLKPGPPPRQPAIMTATAATAVLACLLMVPVFPFATEHGVTQGAITSSGQTTDMTLFSVQAAVIAIGVLLLLARNTAGRWLIAAGDVSLTLFALYVMGWSWYRGIAQELLPLAAVTATVSAILALRRSTGVRRQWLKPGPPPRQPAIMTATAATAVLACLLMVPVFPFATEHGVTQGAITSSGQTTDMTLFSVQAAVIAIGVLLLLARNTAGRWLIAAGDVSLTLFALYVMGWSWYRGIAQELLPLAAVTATLSAILALRRSTGVRRQWPR